MTNEQAEFSKQVADTIIEQLGGRMFQMMTDAKNFRYFDNGVVFKIGRNCRNISFVRVSLNGRDLYDVDFMKVYAGNVKTAASVTDIYFDQLQSTFTENTGMYTRL